ncbi:MAG: hypothetical protein ACOVMM_06690 [Chitinophagaceae bacterium]
MKKTIIILAVAVATTFSTFAQSEKYYGAMGATLQQYGAAKTPEELDAIGAKFERIGDAEKTQWLPFYYAALIKTNKAMQNKGEAIDKIADEAAAILAKAEAIEANNSEIWCVKSMIATAKMLVNPMERWMQYGQASTEYIAKAKAADATNPRPYMLEAISKKNTPENFGGGCKVAKAIADKANELFAAFKPASQLHPFWGKEILEGQMKSCN